MIKYNTHRIIITIIIVLIKNYYVNSYLTTCMAQSIKLVSCNNNNKDTTIYLLVSLSSFNLRHLIFCVCSSLLFFFCLFLLFSSVAITPLLYIPMHTSSHSILLTIEKTGNFKYQSTLITFQSYYCNI